jgi:hypothetical protein
MAIGARNHGDIHLPSQHILRADRSMAHIAIDSGTDMLLVAEGNEGWQLVHANPGNSLAVF